MVAACPLHIVEGGEVAACRKGRKCAFLWGPTSSFPHFFVHFFKKNQGEKGGCGGLIKGAGNNKSRPFVRNPLMHHHKRIFKFFFFLLFSFLSGLGLTVVPPAQTQGLSACISLGGKIRKWDLVVLGHYICVPTSWMPKKLFEDFPFILARNKCATLWHCREMEMSAKKIPCGKKRARKPFFSLPLSISHSFSLARIFRDKLMPRGRKGGVIWG